MNIIGILILCCCCLSSIIMSICGSSSSIGAYLNYKKNETNTYNLNDIMGNPTCELKKGWIVTGMNEQIAPKTINGMENCRNWCIKINSKACSYKQISSEISECKSYSGTSGFLDLDFKSIGNKKLNDIASINFHYSGFCRRQTKNRCILDNKQTCDSVLDESKLFNYSSSPHHFYFQKKLNELGMNDNIFNSIFDSSNVMTKKKCQIFCSADPNIKLCKFISNKGKNTCTAYSQNCKIVPNTNNNNTYYGSCK